MERFIVGSTWDRTNRNGINNNFDYLFEGVATMNNLNIKADATLLKADAVLMNAQSTNQSNVDVQNQLDNIILESGTSDAEVVQSRTDYNGNTYPLLKDRLNNIDKSILSHGVNLIDFGAVGDGVTDDTQAIKDAITHAESLGSHTPVYMPHGVYKTTETITLSNPLYGHDATINYNGTDTALVVGDESAPGKVTSRKKFSLPRVINRLRGSDGWDGTSVGVRCVNLNTCELYVPFIQDFETGLLMYGYSQGCTYNTVNLGALWNNHKNLVMMSNDTGWSNQTLFLNGRLQQDLTKGAIENDENANQILIGGKGIELSSNNTFINTSIEGYNVSKYRIDLSGSYNHFYNLRNETHGDYKSKVIYRNNTFRNHIQGGYHMHLLEEVFEGNATGGTIDDTRAIHFISKINEQQIAKSTEFITLNSFVSSGHRFKVEENGDFILRPGMWEITVTLNYQPSTGGAYYSRILKNNSVQASKVAIPNATYQIPFTATATVEIKPGDVVTIQTKQSTATESLKLNGTSFSSVTGKYLGGNI